MMERPEEFLINDGLQYYVAARSAWLAGLAPVCGSLYHHAIERLLKARLSRTHSLEKLSRRPFGHDLQSLWHTFKAQFSAGDLERFDGIIAAIHRFEELRYPDKAIVQGAVIHIALAPAPLPGFSESQKYEIAVTDIDHLIAAIFRICSWNPKAFTGSMNDRARDALTQHNPVGADWLDVATAVAIEPDEEKPRR